jgi:hypothetical protein
MIVWSWGIQTGVSQPSARGAMTHLRMHYPATLAAVPSSAERSPRNTISADIRSHFEPLLSVMNDLERN